MSAVGERDEDAVVASMDWRCAIRTLYAIGDRMGDVERALRSRHPEAWTPSVCAGASLYVTGLSRDVDLCLRAIERDLCLIDDQTAAELADLAASSPWAARFGGS